VALRLALAHEPVQVLARSFNLHHFLFKQQLAADNHAVACDGGHHAPARHISEIGRPLKHCSAILSRALQPLARVRLDSLRHRVLAAALRAADEEREVAFEQTAAWQQAVRHHHGFALCYGSCFVAQDGLHTVRKLQSCAAFDENA
jgi:hypothetical protein